MSDFIAADKQPLKNRLAAIAAFARCSIEIFLPNIRLTRCKNERINREDLISMFKIIRQLEACEQQRMSTENGGSP